MKEQILILGAGVSGLSTGIILLQRGYQVTIWAKAIPPYTTSNKAAAVWYPFICGSPEKATQWAKSTLEHFRKEVLPDPLAGCSKNTVVELFEEKVKDPWWKDGVDTFKRINPEKLQKGYTDGYEIEGLVMDTDIYMQYLVDTFKKLGGVLLIKTIDHIAETFQAYATVVNCTGLGSFSLFDDKKLYPTRGQIVKIKPNGFGHSVFEQEGRHSLAYIVPRSKDIVLGGTAQKHDWNTKVNDNDTQDIIKKCSNLYPTHFDKVEVLSVEVGLRPSRGEIRLEIERFGDTYVIHNYGHGGAGFTLSWGCAQAASDLVSSVLYN